MLYRADGSCSVAWKLEGLRKRLNFSRGFPLLSPTFAIAGLSEELRLMFAPGKEWQEWLEAPAASSCQQVRRHGSRPAAAAAAEAGRTFGAVRLKAVGECEASGSFRFRVFIGEAVAGELAECSLSERSVHSCDLHVDWRDHVQASDNLSLRLDFAPP